MLLLVSVMLVSNQVQKQQLALQLSDADLHKKQEDIKALKAEWSYLTRPQRLEALKGGHDPDKHKGEQP